MEKPYELLQNIRDAFIKATGLTPERFEHIEDMFEAWSEGAKEVPFEKVAEANGVSRTEFLGWSGMGECTMTFARFREINALYQRYAAGQHAGHHSFSSFEAMAEANKITQQELAEWKNAPGASVNQMVAL